MSDTILLIIQKYGFMRGANLSQVELDCWAVVAHFGGLAKTSRLMKQHGVDLSVDAIEKWRRRGNIPTSQLVTLAAIARANGVRFDIYDFIKDKSKPNLDRLETANGRSTRANVGPKVGNVGD